MTYVILVTSQKLEVDVITIIAKSDEDFGWYLKNLADEKMLKKIFSCMYSDPMSKMGWKIHKIIWPIYNQDDILNWERVNFKKIKEKFCEFADKDILKQLWVGALEGEGVGLLQVIKSTYNSVHICPTRQ